jgi:transaldolase/glucose-6-phosphate isomerase
MGTQLKELAAVGQSIWLDNIRRNMFATGELQRLIDTGLRGMTSNPTIFEKAIGSSKDYDHQLRELLAGKEKRDSTGTFEALAIRDIRSACDLFAPIYKATNGLDGYVSLEVSPTLAHDTQGTIAAAARLWKAVDRPNVMIKIPGTPEGIPAIRKSIADGINVNVTLLFSVERYAAAAEAYIAGLEDRVKAGGAVAGIASVASVFVSRIDTAIDKLLDGKINAGEKVDHLLGKAGIANLKLTYQKFLELFEHSSRFEALAAKGAHVQRPLWASTSTKNPHYDDLMYIVNVVGRDTVNTVPEATMGALLDHGRIKADTVLADIGGAHAAIDALAKIGIKLYDVTEQLVADGVKSFAESFQAMLSAIEKKQAQLAGGNEERVRLALGGYQDAYTAAVKELADGGVLAKLGKGDPSPWSSEPEHVAIIKNALGWVDIPEKTLDAVPALRELALECAKRFAHVVVLGMGGSSLAPDVLRATFGRAAGFPQLHVLDSTDPVQVRALDDELDVKKSLFIVASKSGTTTEPEAFFRYYHKRVTDAGVTNPGAHFIAITDPGTKLESEARTAGFLRIFLNAADIGGRYSALSYFGMVPAALAGYDVETILDRAIGAMHANAASVPVADAPGVRFGAAIGSLAKAGRDKLTIVTHPRVSAFGAWAEQLIAESTGKSGRGIVPIEGEPLGSPSLYGSDRVFAYVGADLEGASADDEAKLAALEAVGHPVIRLAMHDTADIGEQFYLWEIATACAGSLLDIDAFDQPNVQESKDNTKRLLGEYEKSGKFAEPTPKLNDGAIGVIPLKGSQSIALGRDLAHAVAAVAAQIKAGDYVAFNAYVAMTPEHQALLRGLRVKLRDAFKVATTVGFGPRFLHSTGQLHKGGPNSGVFFQITYDPPYDMEIPGMGKFGVLERAQALGDFESLDKRDRRGARIHLGADADAGLRKLAEAVDAALTTRA